MREIEFRGQRVDNKQWIYGYLYEHEPPLQCCLSNTKPEESKWYIAKTAFADWNMPRQIEYYEVIPETVGQFIGLLDIKGKKIYEGDIVDNGYTIIYSCNSSREFRFIGIVKYDVKNGCIVINNTDGYSKRLTQKTIKKDLTVKVIGNISENPSLLNK